MSRDPAGSTPGASSSSGPAANAAKNRTAAEAAESSTKRPRATTPAQLDIRFFPPAEVYAFWERLGTPNQMDVNPRFDPMKGDGAVRYRAIHYDKDCVARCTTRQERERQEVRNLLRRRDYLTYKDESEELLDVLGRSGYTVKWPNGYVMSHLSEWLSTALRHKPFHDGSLSRRFCKAVWSFDEYDGWVHVPDLLTNWPPEGNSDYHSKFLEEAFTWLHKKPWAYQILLILAISGIVDHKTGMQKHRLQIKKIVDTHDREATRYYIRASNGHAAPGLKCPESLYSAVTVETLRLQDAPTFFMHGTSWDNIPSILEVGLSCLGEDNPKGKSGRQFIHGCPYLPGDDRIQSGLRPDSEVILMISVSQLVRDKIPVWRSANDIVMTKGQQGRIPVGYIIQMIGIKHNAKYRHDRTGQVWGWAKDKQEAMQEDGRGSIDGQTVSKMEYEVAGDPTTLLPLYNSGWFTPVTPYNLKMQRPAVLPAPPTAGNPASRQETVLMINDMSAGQPAMGSDGSWIHATDMTDLSMPTTNGDNLYAADPWRQAAASLGQPTPEPAGQPAAYHPGSGGRSGATTPFGTPGSHASVAAPSQNSLYERIHNMRMDPHAQAMAAHPDAYAGHPAPQAPAMRQPSEQEADSMRAQQHFQRRMQGEAIAMMARDRVDLHSAGWLPPWSYIPSAYASPDHPDRQVYIPAIMAHPDYSGMPNAGQPAAQMDAAMFPDHHAATDNIPRVGNMPTNTVVRDMTDEFFRAQETRGSPGIPGAQGQIPHYGYLPPPMDPNTVQFGPAQPPFEPIPFPQALTNMRPEIWAIHESQQANLQQRQDRQRRNQAQNVRQIDLSRPPGEPPMRGNLQAQPVEVDSRENLPPPSPYRSGETTLDRQRRVRPQAPSVTIMDTDFRQCVICLEQFRNDEVIWRLQCGHTFHKDCWNNVAHTHVQRQNRGDHIEAPCAVCRGTGTIVAEFTWVLAGQPANDVDRQAMHSANELRDLREELQRATAQIEVLASSAGQPARPATVAEGNGEDLPAIMGRRQMSRDTGTLLAGRADGHDRLSGLNYAGQYQQMPPAPLVTEHDADIEMSSIGGTTRPANDAWLARMEANASRGNQMPYGRSRAPTRGNSQRARASESVRSSSSGILSDRELLNPIFMIDDQPRVYRYGMASEGTFLNMSLTQTNPAEGLEYPTDAIFRAHPITQEEHEGYSSTWSALRKPEWVLEQRRRRNEVGAHIVQVPYSGPDRIRQVPLPTVALAANPATQIEDENTILMDIGSNVNIVGVRVAQNFERAALRNGHSIKKGRIFPPLFVSGVGSGSAVCNETGTFPIGVQYKRRPAGNPALPARKLAQQMTYEAADDKNPDLEDFVAAIAEGSGENLPAILGRRQMAKDGGILILEEGQEKYITLKGASYKLMLGPGARVVDLKSAPSGHLVMKVDDFANAQAKPGTSAYTLHSSQGILHVLEEHDENFMMADALNRDMARADVSEPTAAHAASSSSDPAPAANAARVIPPPLSWFDTEHRAKMEECHVCMMAMDHTDLDRRIVDYRTDDEGKIFSLYMQNIVDSFLNAWFHDRAPARAASGATLSVPTEGETERFARNIQSLVYQHLQTEIDRQKNERWPQMRGNLPERFDIGSLDDSD